MDDDRAALYYWEYKACHCLPLFILTRERKSFTVSKIKIDNAGFEGVITFIGTTPNIGTTLCAVTAAYRLAEITGQQIGYICLNFKSSKLHRYLGIDVPLATIDDLLPQLRSNSLSSSMLDSAMYTAPHHPSVNILFGNRYREMAEYYSDQEVNQLIILAKQRFKYVILDSSAYWDSAGSICSLQQAEHIIVVTTDALSHFQEDGRAWFGRMSSFIELERSHYYALIIRQHRQSKGYRQHEIINELDMLLLGETELPLPLLDSLDEGDLVGWLTQSSDGKKWTYSLWYELLKKDDKSLVNQSKQMTWKKMRQLWRRKVRESM